MLWATSHVIAASSPRGTDDAGPYVCVTYLENHVGTRRSPRPSLPPSPVFCRDAALKDRRIKASARVQGAEGKEGHAGDDLRPLQSSRWQVMCGYRPATWAMWESLLLQYKIC